jgi:NAD(P)-dependent dehydrogenase (short-subunit alcohol dehydrogenase family)
VNVLITGANRGIGLEFARQLAARNDTIFAGYRNLKAAADLRFPNVQPIALDVSDSASVDRAKREVSARIQRLDLIINNAGVFGPTGGKQRLGSLDADEALDVVRVNFVGPMLIIDRFANLLSKGSKVVTISSGYGSITQAAADWPVYYCCSKAAVNMLSRILSGQLRGRGVSVISLDPGWVATDMGGASAPLQPAESVSGMLWVIDNLSPNDTGKFLSHRGHASPW